MNYVLPSDRNGIKMEQYESLFGILKAAIWRISYTGSVTEEDFLEMKKHVIDGLAANELAVLDMPQELKEKWKTEVLRQISHGIKYRYFQSQLPISVPYVILKGTMAAQYYPYPEYRALGDIDLMPQRKDFEAVCRELLQNGFVETTPHETEKRGRHRCFSRDGFLIEVHAFFAMLQDPMKAKAMDDLILECFSPSHMLPDMVNGLVLLEHISQHLEAGLGLRQIIDWMMFVDKCLPDSNWPTFRTLAERVGLTKLAEVATRMCVIYLGLPNRQWCSFVDEESCCQLMAYVMACGNFGNKRVTEDAIAENAFAMASTPRAAFRLLQERGLVNWKAANRYPILRPFAWIYQAFRYSFRGLRRHGAAGKLNNERLAAKKRRALFDSLGVYQFAKGTAVYRERKYVKEH